MVTFSTARGAVLALLVTAALTACSREQEDWQAAEGVHTREAYAHFIEQHPDSELTGEARARLAQLDEERDWAHAEGRGSLEAYRTFLSQHPRGRLAEQARIRIEGFSLGSAPRTELTPRVADARAGVSALQLMHAPVSGASPDAPAPAPSALERGDTVPAATPAAAPVSVPPAPPVNAATSMPAAPLEGYGVQLGAFGSEASADREWQRLQARFGSQLAGLAPRIVLASAAGAPLYRLQAPAAGEAEARALCDSLKEQAQACVPVIPR
ncbi:MAG: SPOR domain-containing protein [Gammaproteobacteria bacterium]|nr:SPOR domain-containing protein [Gammaproteobacteria bacterium]